MVIIVFYGSQITEAEANSLKEILSNKYPLADIGFIEGKQEVYDFIISLE
jgi:dihydroxyacetone kinase-like predicted kinase